MESRVTSDELERIYLWHTILGRPSPVKQVHVFLDGGHEVKGVVEGYSGGNDRCVQLALGHTIVTIDLLRVVAIGVVQ